MILFCSIIYRKANSPSLFLISIYLISLFCGYLIGQNYAINSFSKVLNLLFLICILTLFILPWNKFRYKISISEPNPKILRFYTTFLFIVNGLSLCVIIIIFYSVHPQVTDYESFKNDGIAYNVIKNLSINRFFLFSQYFHVTAYFLVPIHFYYFIKEKYLLSLISFLFSLNIALFGLTVFSRSGIIEYLILYIFYFQFFYIAIKKKMKYLFKNKIILIFSFAVATGFGYLVVFFYQITENRFKDATIKFDTFIENPGIFYLFDYASQWFKNSNEVMSLYRFETLNGELSFPLLYVTARKLQLIHYPVGTLGDTLKSVWGEYHHTFNGLIANLVFDLGYLGTTLFAIIYFIVVFRLKPVRGRITFNSFLVLGVIFIIPAMGIFNSHLRLIFYNALIIYTITAYLCSFILKQKIK